MTSVRTAAERFSTTVLLEVGGWAAKDCTTEAVKRYSRRAKTMAIRAPLRDLRGVRETVDGGKGLGDCLDIVGL
jgi:hypothetical protein